MQFDRGLLTVSGERKADLPPSDKAVALHINERFAGPFRRALTLPDDADPDAVDARYNDGVLRITIQRRASAQPRRINVH